MGGKVYCWHRQVFSRFTEGMAGGGLLYVFSSVSLLRGLCVGELARCGVLGTSCGRVGLSRAECPRR